MDSSPESTDTPHLLHPCHDANLQSKQLIWTSGRGAVLVDQTGHEYLDGISGLWNVLVGHGRGELAKAAQRQMVDLAFASTYSGSSNLPAIALARRLADLCYPEINRFYFTTSGAEANEAAFKAARYFWRRAGYPAKTHVIARRGDYHGTTFAALSSSGVDKYLRAFEPRMPGFSWIETPPHCQPGAEVSGYESADALEREILRLGAANVAAFIAEPVVGVGGVYVPPKDYWPRIREICSRYDVLLIADEVLTGFGRLGDWFALGQFNIQPDIVTFAKGITSGYVPLGGIGVNSEIGDCIASARGEDAWLHAATNSAHPVACAVALENIAILERDNLLRRARELEHLVRNLLEPVANHPLVQKVRGIGLLWAIELNTSTREKIGFEVLAAARNRGLFTRARAELIHLAPCLTIEERQLEQMVAIVRDALDSLA